MRNACSPAYERVCSASLQSDNFARNILSSNGNIWFKDNHVYVGHETWCDIVRSESGFPLYNALETFKNIVQRNGAAMILMPDEISIDRRMDRISEVQDVAHKANATRLNLGLPPVDLQQLGL